MDKILEAFKNEKEFIEKDYANGKEYLSEKYYQGYLDAIKRCSELIKNS